MANQVTILISYSPASLFYSIIPFLESSYSSYFQFTNQHEWCLKKDKNKKLIIIRYFEKLKSNNDILPFNLLEKLCEKYESVIFFDDTDSTGKTHFEALQYVDFYIKKQILKDKGKYTDKLYGSYVVSDYYHKFFKVADDIVRDRVPLGGDDFDKLKISWNLAAGIYPVKVNHKRFFSKINEVINVPKLTISLLKSLKRKEKTKNYQLFDVHARFSFHSRPTISFQRKLFFDILKNKDNVLLGKADPKQYNYELKNSKITISPFGWGEICYRDFEAMFNYSVLIKPDVSHLETWPNLFLPYETYIPVKWDGTDLVDKIDYYLSHKAELKRIAENAYDCLKESLYKDQYDQRVGQLLNLLNV